MRYESIDQKQGREMAPYIKTVYFTKDPDFFITPWGDRNLRSRCNFQVDHTIDLLLTEEEVKSILGDSTQTDDFFLYGAFNEIYVNQVKISGSLSVLKKESVGISCKFSPTAYELAGYERG